LAEIEEETKPFRYARTFESVANERPVTEMDKEALQSYINKILGTKDAKANSTELAAK
jgi:hypothetical protein